MMIEPDLAARAAELIAQSDGLVIAAGAGIGADSGLPDFRGNEGFWQAYPALGRARMEFTSVASPRLWKRRIQANTQGDSMRAP